MEVSFYITNLVVKNVKNNIGKVFQKEQYGNTISLFEPDFTFYKYRQNTVFDFGKNFRESCFIRWFGYDHLSYKTNSKYS
jgi:hypothetical protein